MEVKVKSFTVAVIMVAWQVVALAAVDQGEDRLYDGKLDPTCKWDWKKKPIEVVTDFGETREIGGVRFWAGRCWVSCGPRKASFWIEAGDGKGGTEWKCVCPTKEFRPAHTYKQSYALWSKVKCRRVKMVIEDAYEAYCGYYMGYMHAATRRIRELLWTPDYTIADHAHPKVEIAELEYFAAAPSDLPCSNPGHDVAYPDSRLVFDWMLQSCNVSNVSHVASVGRDTTKGDPLGESVG